MDAGLTVEEAVSPLPRVEVDADLIGGFCSEEDFNELAVKLGVELGNLVCVVGSVVPGNGSHWTRNEAIVVGLLVRFQKLLQSILDETCQHRRETAYILCRLAFESLVNLRYLMGTRDEAVYDGYVLASLRHEKRLVETIERNIEERGGEVWPIEQRMMRSIERAFERSGVTRTSVTRDGMRPWSDTNVYQRAEAVGWGPNYLGLFAGPSHSVHGNWMDLLEYHLSEHEGGFMPDYEWHHPRPQLLLVLGLFGCTALGEYIARLSETHEAGHEAAPLMDLVHDLQERIAIANEGHEAFLQR
ncbi:DUF5677 domain-containing protein [Nisaea acidiphila]|uniref:DUF5677 domain-containing protein n=1 Tax=Nisaea acidiphila TaxID=1862145 RepID=A0A9J7AK93_9PROT|nr:DUF5677 domain-containing protein [Nisaea acidiphila]UUX48091.1 DUF5677 domain-containing protein [Nisaea acidiphila]